MSWCLYVLACYVWMSFYSHFKILLVRLFWPLLTSLEGCLRVKTVLCLKLVVMIKLRLGARECIMWTNVLTAVVTPTCTVCKYLCVIVRVCKCVFEPCQPENQFGLWNPCQCPGLRHPDPLGKAATLINGNYPKRSHCLIVNVLFIFHMSVCSRRALATVFTPEIYSNQIPLAE